MNPHLPLVNSRLSPEAGRPLRVLIVRIGAMGDVLHAMPAVAALRERHPEWTIGWAIEPGWSEFGEAACRAGGVRENRLSMFGIPCLPRAGSSILSHR